MQVGRMRATVRYRTGNLRESEAARAKRLINSDDALSTQEQDQVLQYLAGSVRSSVALLRVLAVLQLLLAFLYLGMLAAGYPLVYAVFDDGTPLTFGGAIALLTSSLILGAGGLCDLHTCRRTLRIDVATLVEAGYIKESATGASGERKSASTAAMSVAELPRYHYVLGFLALWPALYWLYVMRAYYTHMSQQGPLLFGVADNWMELVLVLWQPGMHVVFAQTLRSIVSGKNDLLRLAQLKYRYDKL
ncbi:uncharacterized protein Tco025E_03049 [Trypanosoma conorhini]|uniref:Uncharacterized protein n=1 Tax=Trypanosoma conorhini TaxID=83891 RepID=A0A422PXX8_9TRYP|nr:uncharacterized protein Tco025E_03049 [Trypanosoma conorhini]RNF22562.1 hypothetical protein Tco025E_03049 [Trypanosoma conorhini]